MTNDPNKSKVRRSKLTDWIWMVLLVFLTVILYSKGLTASLGAAIDAPHHLANSVFIYDAIRDPLASLQNPKAFILNYYSHFPAVNVGFYPPVFYTVAAVLMFIFGVSGNTVQLTVLFFSIAMSLCSYRWLRCRLPPAWAGMGTLLITTAPILVFFGRDIMLEIPVLALTIASIWAFERVLEENYPRWGAVLTWCALALLAIGTKQNAVVLVPFFFLVMLAKGRLRLIMYPPMAVCLALVIVFVAGMVLLLSYIGGDAIPSTLGSSIDGVKNRFIAFQWLYYVKNAPWLVGWPLIWFSTLGIIVGLFSRERSGLIIPVAWLFSFYFVHSYMEKLDYRYATLCIPALALLSAQGLYGLPRLVSPKKYLTPSVKTVSWAVIIFLVVNSLDLSGRVEVPRVSNEYVRAMAEVRDQLGQFTCLTFAQVPSRPASLYRLAIEEQLPKQGDLFSYGRILRAVQVLGRRRGLTPQGVAEELKEWNVTMILIEKGGNATIRADVQRTAEMLEQVLALGEFDLVASYTVEGFELSWPVRNMRLFEDRTLNLYRRRLPIEYNKLAAPPIQPRRSSFTLPSVSP